MMEHGRTVFYVGLTGGRHLEGVEEGYGTEC